MILVITLVTIVVLTIFLYAILSKNAPLSPPPPPACSPSCDHKSCGNSDGCGGLCGCKDGDVCLNGTCSQPVNYSPYNWTKWHYTTGDGYIPYTVGSECTSFGGINRVRLQSPQSQPIEIIQHSTHYGTDDGIGVRHGSGNFMYLVKKTGIRGDIAYKAYNTPTSTASVFTLEPDRSGAKYHFSPSSAKC